MESRRWELRPPLQPQVLRELLASNKVERKRERDSESESERERKRERERERAIHFIGHTSNRGI